MVPQATGSCLALLWTTKQQLWVCTAAVATGDGQRCPGALSTFNVMHFYAYDVPNS